MLQACLNGNRSRTYHAAVPLTARELAADAIACHAAGAREFHIHPRDQTGAETFDATAIATALLAMRTAVPDAAIGLSTREGILADPRERQQAFAAWRELPDYVSVNLSEVDAPEVIQQMLAMGVGIEAGLATVADAERYIALSSAAQSLRILIEIEEQVKGEAITTAKDIIAVLDRAGLAMPRQLHGYDAGMWWMFDMAVQLGYEQRIGLEDGKFLPDGRLARDNAELIAATAGPSSARKNG